jgi:hypothetical protein
LSIPQNTSNSISCGLLKTLLYQFRFKTASIARQPSLILYSYDVTTGVVVDIGEQLSIVPVIDEYIVENALISLPIGAKQIREHLAKAFSSQTNGAYSFTSPIEELLLRYACSQACYVALDYEKETNNPGSPDSAIGFGQFNIGNELDSKVKVDSTARFQATEGLFKPKRWNLEIKGIHQLIHDAIQQSPIDSRRILYR